MSNPLHLPIGTHVTYDDEDPNAPVIAGVIAVPTADEVKHAKTYTDPVGPEHGDVLVAWDQSDTNDRSWERPSDLQVITTEAS